MDNVALRMYARFVELFALRIRFIFTPRVTLTDLSINDMHLTTLRLRHNVDKIVRRHLIPQIVSPRLQINTMRLDLATIDASVRSGAIKRKLEEMSVSCDGHIHDASCSKLVLVPNEYGTLRARFFCEVMKTVDDRNIDVYDPRVTKKLRTQLLSYPDTNNVCLLSQALENPLSVYDMISRGLDLLLKRHGDHFHQQVKDVLMHALRTKNLDMLRLMFCQLMITDVAFRGNVLQQSDRAVGHLIMQHIFSLTRSLFFADARPDNAASLLKVTMAYLRDNVTFKRTSFIRTDVLSCFIIDDADIHHFQTLYPLPSFAGEAVATASVMNNEHFKLSHLCHTSIKLRQKREITLGRNELWQELMLMQRKGPEYYNNLSYPECLHMHLCTMMVFHYGESASTAKSCENVRELNEKVFDKWMREGNVDKLTYSQNALQLLLRAVEN